MSHIRNSNLSLVSWVITWININSCSTSTIITFDLHLIQSSDYLTFDLHLVSPSGSTHVPPQWAGNWSLNILVEFILIICLKDNSNKEMLNQWQSFVQWVLIDYGRIMIIHTNLIFIEITCLRFSQKCYLNTVFGHV